MNTNALRALLGSEGVEAGRTESTKVAIHAFAASPYIYVYDIDPVSGFTGGPRSPSGANIIPNNHFGGITMKGDYIVNTGIQNATNSAVWKDTGSAVNLLSGANGLQSLPAVNGLQGGCEFASAGGDPTAYLYINAGNSGGIVSYSRSGDAFTTVGTVGGNAQGDVGTHADADGEYFTHLSAIDTHDGDGTFTSYATSFTSIPSNPSGAVSLEQGGKRYAAWAGSGSVQFYDVSTGTPSLMSQSGVMTGTMRGAAFNPDNIEQVLVFGDSSPYAQIVELSGSTWTAVSSPFDTAPSAACQGGDWSNAGGMIVLATTSSPYILAYAWDGSNATKFANPSTLPAGAPSRESVSFN